MRTRAEDASRATVWEREFDRWLRPFWTALGDKRRQRWAPVYARGLLGPGERKSIEPMAARVAPDDVEQLHHFVCTSCWDPAPLERVLADTGYGASADFRRALSARGFTWAMGVPKIQKVYPADVRLRMPRTKPGARPRVHPVPTRARVSAEDLLASARWRVLTWRVGTKGPLRARFAAVRVVVADGVVDAGNRHLPGEAAWLVGEARVNGVRKYYLTNHPATASLRTLAAAIKARWSCEQAHQQLKEELGLDHFEGRSWLGLHHHALLTMISFAFLQHLRLREARRRKKNPPGAVRRHRPTAGAHAPSDPAHAPHTRTPAPARPTPLPKMPRATHV